MYFLNLEQRRDAQPLIVASGAGGNTHVRSHSHQHLQSSNRSNSIADSKHPRAPSPRVGASILALEAGLLSSKLHQAADLQYLTLPRSEDLPPERMHI